MLSFLHIFIIALSNILVQYPFELFGLKTTYGAFTYPAIFILTDLSTRLKGPEEARKIIFRSMLPGFIISYLVASILEDSAESMWVVHTMPLRIALACFVAYVLGQLLDIVVFQRIRNTVSWWPAPLCSSLVGNLLDTAVFFFIAFYHCNNAFLSQHWLQIASVDLCFKIIISIFAFIPVYGLIISNYTFLNKGDPVRF